MRDIVISDLSFSNLTLLGKTLESIVSQEKEITLDLRKLPFCKPEQILHLALILKDFKRRKKAPATILIDELYRVCRRLFYLS